MTRLDSPRVVSYAGLAAFGLIAGLVVGRVELVALAAPFALAAVVGAALARDPQISATIALDQERALEGEDVHRAYAGIALPNPASVGLHERFGFKRVGHFTEQGRKFGRYWDVAWYEKPLGSESTGAS